MCFQKTPFSRRDYYKISFILGVGRLHYGDKIVEVNKPAILFASPLLSYAWEALSEEQNGWFCLFNESFLTAASGHLTGQHISLLEAQDTTLLFVDDVQQQVFADIFKKMMTEISSTYTYKYEVLRNYLELMIHELVKMQHDHHPENKLSASARLTHTFMELLERQFPIDSPDKALQLRTANHFAERLSVHVNHLNRSVKEVTGKTTTALIASRITREAIALLKYTNWDVAQIAYALGFEYPSYFHIFFKKQTGLTPSISKEIFV